MPRNVKTILEEDKKKATLGGEEEHLNEGAVGDEDGILIEGEEEDKEKKTGSDKKKAAEDEAAELRKQLAAEKARAEREAARADDAEARATTADTKAKSALDQQIQTRESEIDAKISNAKTNLDSIKQQLKTARAAGDTDAEVDLQDAMTNARYELNAAEWEKKNFATWKTNQQKTSERSSETDTTSPYTVKERAWIKQHPEFNTNKKFARIAKVAAQEARDEGLAQDSSAYFSYIEDALKDAGLLEGGEEPLSGAGENTSTTTSVAAAPKNDGGQKTTTGPNPKYPFIPRGFRIPSDWVQAATDQGFEDPREYANMRLENEAHEKGRA